MKENDINKEEEEKIENKEEEIMKNLKKKKI
jgi:hypothetical protein